jgi:hypothetical protein
VPSPALMSSLSLTPNATLVSLNTWVGEFMTFTRLGRTTRAASQRRRVVGWMPTSWQYRLRVRCPPNSALTISDPRSDPARIRWLADGVTAGDLRFRAIAVRL